MRAADLLDCGLRQLADNKPGQNVFYQRALSYSQASKVQAKS